MFQSKIYTTISPVRFFVKGPSRVVLELEDCVVILSYSEGGTTYGSGTKLSEIKK